MSAIWGIVDFKEREISADEIEKMTQPYRAKAIDRIETLTRGHFFMACGIQYVTPEAQYEHAAYLTPGGQYISGDILLDNRRELQTKYRLPAMTAGHPAADGELLAACYGSDPEAALRDLLGAYSFVAYDPRRQTVRLISDVVGNRALYYTVKEQRLYYSTLIGPLQAAAGDSPLNEGAVVDFLGNDSLIHFSQLHTTLYEGIYKLEAGEVVTVTPDGQTRAAYWDPVNDIAVIDDQPDEYYKERFLQVFNECVTSYLRTDAETAILLSGGLDSTAVGSLAAPALADRGKQLHSFTWVPTADYDPDSFAPHAYFPDERRFVELFCRMYPNITPQFLTSSADSLWNDRFELMQILESPYKSIQNINWIYRAFRGTQATGGRLLLTGQCGNGSISDGDILTLLNTLIKQGKLRQAARAIKTYSRVNGCGRSFLYRCLWDEFREPRLSARTFYDTSFVQTAKLKQYKIFDLLTKPGESYIPKYLTADFERRFMYFKMNYRQISEIETKFSLATGVISRDPTKDKRLISLLLTFPYRQFADAATQRRLIRIYMHDLIPAEILNMQKKGMQGSDLIYLLKPVWPDLAAQLKRAFQAPGLGRLLKVRQLSEFVDHLPLNDQPLQPLYEKLYKALYYGLTCDFLSRRPS